MLENGADIRFVQMLLGHADLHANLREVIAMLLEDGEPRLETEFIGTQTVVV